MNIEKALTILGPLSEGIDPYTGELFSPDSPYQHADTVRALYTAIDILEKKLARDKRHANSPVNAGSPWSEEEDADLIKEFDSGHKISELAKLHERTHGAIQSRLIKLGKIAQ